MTPTRRQILAAGATAAAVEFRRAPRSPTTRRLLRPGQAANVPFRLGIVTYNIAATWDLPTILRICRSVGLGPVELRTTHRHGVEPTLNADQRRDVRRHYTDSGVEFWGCGSVCEFQA